MPISFSFARLKRNPGDPYIDLALAIVAVAADDYRSALRSGNEKLRKSIEDFFHSDWYSILVDLDPDILLDQISREITTGG